MIELTGGIPAGWTSARIDSLVRHRNQFGDLSLPLLGVSVRHGVVRRDGNEGRAASEDLGGYRVVRSGDLVVNKLVARDGAFGRAHEDGLVSPAYWVLVPEEGADVRFLDYSLRSTPGLASIRRLSKDMPPAQFDWPWPSAKAMRIPLAPVARQRAIADFLDRECARIDELTREANAAKEAVRLDLSGLVDRMTFDAPRVRLRFALTRIEQGWSPVCDDREAEPGEWGVLKLGCVNHGRFRDEHKALGEGLAPRPQLAVRTGDVLMSRANTRDLVGSCALVTECRPQLMLSDLLYRLGVDSSRWEAEYVVLGLNSQRVRQEIRAVAAGSAGSMPKLNHGLVKDLTIPDLSTGEQAKLVAQVREESVRPLRLIGEYERLLASIEQYRDALITEAVTGKLDVTAANEARMSDNLAAVREEADPEVLA